MSFIRLQNNANGNNSTKMRWILGMLLIEKHPEFFIFFLFMSYSYLLCFLLLITHKSVPEDNELTDERNKPGKLP